MIYFAQNLKYLRRQWDMRQNKLAEILGISQAAVGNWELGKREPELSMLARIAEYFDVSLDDLILRELSPPIPSYVSNIKYLREKHGIMQAEVADLLGISKANASKYENGLVGMTIEQFIKLADFLG